MTESLVDENVLDIPPETDPNKNYLPEMLEKFKTPEALAKGKYESDNYIKLLERRLDSMRDDYTKTKEEMAASKRLEELINQLSERPSEPKTPTGQEEHQPTFDPKQLESLVSSKIQEHELSRQQAENFKMVEDRLIQHYGDNYKSKVWSQAKELGLTEQDINRMARTQPKVLIRSLGLDNRPNERDPFQSPPSSSMRTGTSTNTGQQDRTWSYYEELKQKNPKAWLDKKTAIQMQEDAIRLGDKFYDGNFYQKGLHER